MARCDPRSTCRMPARTARCGIVPRPPRSGDCRSRVFVWEPNGAGKWTVAGKAFQGHTASVEDIQWSPVEPGVFITCSVDQVGAIALPYLCLAACQRGSRVMVRGDWPESVACWNGLAALVSMRTSESTFNSRRARHPQTIRVWDAGARDKPQITVKAHDADVNVLSWNRLATHMLASGGDEGALRIWDLRMFAEGKPVADFRYHGGPIGAVEWVSVRVVPWSVAVVTDYNRQSILISLSQSDDMRAFLTAVPVRELHACHDGGGRPDVRVGHGAGAGRGGGGRAGAGAGGGEQRGAPERRARAAAGERRAGSRCSGAWRVAACCATLGPGSRLCGPFGTGQGPQNAGLPCLMPWDACGALAGLWRGVQERESCCASAVCPPGSAGRQGGALALPDPWDARDNGAGRV